MLAAVVGILAVRSWFDPLPLESQMGFENSLAAIGLVGAGLSLVAAFLQPAMRWPLGVAVAAGVLLAISTRVPNPSAGDSMEYVSVIAGYGLAALMGLAAVVALLVPRLGSSPEHVPRLAEPEEDRLAG